MIRIEHHLFMAHRLLKTGTAAPGGKRKCRIQATVAWITVAFLRLQMIEQEVLEASPAATALEKQANRSTEMKYRLLGLTASHGPGTAYAF